MKNITVKYDNIEKNTSIPDRVEMIQEVINELTIEVIQQKFKESLDLFSRTGGFNDTDVISTILSTTVWDILYTNKLETIIDEVE